MAIYTTEIPVEIEKEGYYYEGLVEVVGEYSPYCPGLRGSCGEPLEPDEPGGFEIIEITTPEGIEIKESDLSAGEIDQAIEALFAQLEEEYYK